MTYLPPYVDETGMHIAGYSDLLEHLKARMQSIFGADIYLEPDSQDYQLLSAFALMACDVQQGLLAAYNNACPDWAAGAALDRLASLNGVRRRAATQSTCVLTLTGDPRTRIASGVAQDARGFYWDLPEAVTIGDEGTVSVTASCRTPGAVTAAPGDIRTIASPTRGWIAVNNAVPAVPGTDAETDPALRARQKESVAGPSRAVLAGIYAALAALPGVTALRLYDNDTGETADGLPPHSITAVVAGGDAETIARTILAHKTSGCYTNGTTAVTLTDAYGLTNTLRFSRPVPVEITVSLAVTPLAGFTAEKTAALRSALYDYLARREIGEDLYVNNLHQPVLAELADPPDFFVSALTVTRRDGGTVNGAVIIEKDEIITASMADITVEVSA